MRKTMVYRFSLDSGAGIHVFGKGTLKEGTKLVKKLDDEFARRFDKESEGFFTLPFPFHKVPLKVMEGADICAWNEEEQELLFFGFYYDEETESYIPFEEGEEYTDNYWS